MFPISHIFSLTYGFINTHLKKIEFQGFWLPSWIWFMMQRCAAKLCNKLFIHWNVWISWVPSTASYLSSLCLCTSLVHKNTLRTMHLYPNWNVWLISLSLSKFDVDSFPLPSTFNVQRAIIATDGTNKQRIQNNCIFNLSNRLKVQL